MSVAEGERKASNLIEYVIVSRSGTKVVRISTRGVKKLIRKEIKSGVPVADLLTQMLERG